MSLDIGKTENQSFIGLSKDVYKNDKIELDVGAGITEKRDSYIGAHFRLQF